MVGLVRKCWRGGGGDVCYDLYKWSSRCVAWWLADGLKVKNTRDGGVGVEGCLRWMWCVGGCKCVKSVWKCMDVDKVVEVYVIGEVRWYEVVGLVRKCWIGEDEQWLP